MLNIAICDDELKSAKQFRIALRQGFAKKNILCNIEIYEKAELLLYALQRQYFDIICLDIEIGDDNGITIGNHIRDELKNEESKIVYITSYNSYHHDGELYDAAPMAFITKPFNESDIAKIVAKAISRIIPKQETDEDKFVFDFERKTQSIAKWDIIYIQSESRKKVIYTINRNYRINSNMRDIIQKINNPDFFEVVHNACLVNARFVKEISKKKIVLTTGKELRVSVPQHKAARIAMSQFLQRQEQEELQNV